VREGLKDRLCVVLFICVCTRLKWKRVREREVRKEKRVSDNRTMRSERKRKQSKRRVKMEGKYEKEDNRPPVHTSVTERERATNDRRKSDKRRE